MTDPGAWGIEPGYHDQQGRWRDANPASVEAFLNAMDAGPGGPVSSRTIVVRAGEEAGAPAGELHLEDGTRTFSDGRLPSDLPLGYHSLHSDDGTWTVIVSPGRCHLPESLFEWGWALQLYALRSQRSWGIGDLDDLARFGRWASGEGAGMILLNPLHACDPGQASPYFPSSRCLVDPRYLAIDLLPGAEAAEVRAEAESARRLLRSRTIDRSAVHQHQSRAIQMLFERFTGDDAFDAFVRQRGELLRAFGAFAALSERLGGDWRSWPENVRHPGTAAVRRAGAESSAVRAMWMQWHLAAQIDRAGREIDLMHDLAVGIDPGGFDAWYWQDQIAPGVTIGAPPDEFNVNGQSWGLAAFDPWKIAASGFEPFIQTLRANLIGGLRIDHVMGLFRLFWIPPGGSAAEGTYVRYPAGELLDIVALESHRAEAYIVGEDLGTVEPIVRDEMAARSMLSYKVMRFEPGDPSDYPVNALATVSSHDLATIPGLWSGADLAAQRKAGLDINLDAEHALRDRIREISGVDDDASVAEVVDAIYSRLALSPSRILTATLEDALGVEERTNHPGTTDERPNWSVALPLSFEEISEHAGPARVARTLGGRSSRPG